MIRSPGKQHSSNPDISKLVESNNIVLRKRKHEDDFSEALKNHSSELTMTLHHWKAEIQNNISQLKSDLESVVRTDLEKLTASFSEMKTEISNVRKEYQEIRRSIGSLDSKHNETQKQVAALESSVQFHSDQFDDLNKRLESATVGKKAIGSLESRIEGLETENKLLQMELNINNQRDRLLNLEIIGVLETKEEKLIDVVMSIARHANVTLLPQDISEVNRITPKIKQQGRPRNIVVKMKSRLLKDNIISGIRKTHLTNQDLGVHGNTGRIYVNEHLTQQNKLLLKKCRETAKLKQYQYVWTKHGRIFLRRNDTSPAIQVTQEKDLLKIM